MAVIGFAQERPGSPHASFALGKHEIVRKFLVVTDNVFDGPMEVALAIGLPRLFQPYAFGLEFHPFCRCRSVVPERIRPGSKEWEVTCTYTTPDPKSGARGEGGGDSSSDSGSGSDAGGGTGEEKDGEFENPLLAIPEVDTRFETHKQPIYGCQGLGLPASVGENSNNVSCGTTAFFKVGDPVCLSNLATSYYLFNGNILTSQKGTSVNTTISAIDAENKIITLADYWKGPTTSFATLIDMAFRPCMASNGEIFVPPPEMDESRMILTVTRNEDISSPHPALAIVFQDATNSDAFWGAAPGQCKCMSITVQRQVKQLPDGSNFVYLRATYTFQFRYSWDIQLLDKGTWFVNPTTKAQEAFQDANKNPIAGLLDGTGNKLGEGANPIFMTVRPYRALPFAALNLPNSFQEVQ